MQAIHATPRIIRTLFEAQEFVIPEFQRPYSWEEEECENLWNDLVSFYDSLGKSKETYYLGNIVVYRENETDRTWQVIDGQQRITTLFMLIKAMSLRAGTENILPKMMFKTKLFTGEVTNEVRMESKVLPGGGKDDFGDFKKVISGHYDELPDKNQFKRNINLLNSRLADWLEGKNPEELNDFIIFLLERVVLLPIECQSRSDALTLFQTINDRGMPLSPADIFKAKIYQAISSDKNKSNKDKLKFIQAWESLDNHVDLFRTYMHILRSNDNYTGKERDIKDYIIEECLDKGTLSEKWEDIMNSLKKISCVEEDNDLISEDIFVKANIYWNILCHCPHAYWRYPLHVFLHKHLDKKDGSWVLPADKTEEYIALTETVVQYYFIKALVHNSVNVVKDTTYKVCAKIARGEDYIAEYRSCIDNKSDMKKFKLVLNSFNYRRCLRGLVLINSSLNSNQDHVAYLQSLERNIQIEHILPHQWGHYDNWTNTLHERDLNKIGNLIPLERKVNSSAQNEFFSRKQDKYEKSKIQDALDLSDKDKHKHWYPEDLDKRDKESRERLLSFFQGIVKNS